MYIYICVFQYRTQTSKEQLLGGVILPNKGSQIMLWDSSSTWDYGVRFVEARCGFIAIGRENAWQHLKLPSNRKVDVFGCFRQDAMQDLVIQEQSGPDEQWLLWFL